MVEQHRRQCLSLENLDSHHFLTISSFAHACLLRRSEVEITLISDVDLYNFFENAIRGGNSLVCKRVEIANNSYQMNPRPIDPFVEVQEWDATNAYVKYHQCIIIIIINDIRKKSSLMFIIIL